MPEGDTVHLHARHLRPVLLDAPLVDARSRWPGLVHGLAGERVVDVGAVGKNLLLGLSDGTTLRVHLGMKGRWTQVASGAALAGSPGDVSLRLDTARVAVVCTRAPTVERFPSRDSGQHPVLRHLGPDLLADEFDAAAAAARAMRAAPHHETVAEVLLDQRVACGIGNVYKSDVLFLEGLHPLSRPGALPHGRWERVYAHSARLMRRNLRWAPRNTTGLGAGRPRLWVYGRRGRACLRCACPIRSRTHGRDLPRVTFWCPRCQNESTPWSEEP